MGIDSNINTKSQKPPDPSNSGDVVWSSESVEMGKKTEKLLADFFRDIVGLEEFSKDDEESNKHFEIMRFRRTTKREDEREHKGDFVLYRPDKKEYVHFDLTTSVTPSVIREKEKNAERWGLKLLILRPVNIKNALRGAVVDRNIIEQKIMKYVLEIE